MRWISAFAPPIPRPRGPRAKGHNQPRPDVMRKPQAEARVRQQASLRPDDCEPTKSDNRGGAVGRYWAVVMMRLTPCAQIPDFSLVLEEYEQVLVDWRSSVERRSLSDGLRVV